MSLRWSWLPNKQIFQVCHIWECMLLKYVNSWAVNYNLQFLGCSGLGFKAKMKMLASYETRELKESIGTNDVILACHERS